MSFSSLYHEWQRRQRIKNPEKRDHCAYMLIGIMGPEWWIENGWIREYPVGRCLIDFAQPDLKIAIEGDGEAYHMDVLRDERRDSFLRSHGGYVLRFRYNKLHNHPAEVRKTILETYAAFTPNKPKIIKVNRSTMRRSGIKL